MPKSRLTERSIAEAALAVIDAEGIDALTMRRLAAELGTAPMAVYHHFADKDAVLEAVTQLILAEVEPPAPTLDWQDAARHIVCGLRMAGIRHPKAAALLTRFPPRTPDALAFIDAALRTFRAAGFDTAATARAYGVLATFCLGSVNIGLSGYFLTRSIAQAPPDRSLHEISMARLLPTTLEVGAELTAQDRDEHFRLGLELLLAGLGKLRDGQDAAPAG